MATNLATLKTRLNNLADETVDATKATLWLNDAYKVVAARFDWSWLKANSNFQTVVGESDYNLASDLVKLYKAKTSKNELRERNNDWLFSHYPEYPEYPDVADITTQYADATDFVLTNRTIQVFPLPKEVETVYYTYKQEVTELTQDSDEPLIPEQNREVIALGAFIRWLIADEADEYMLNTVKGEFEEAIQKMIVEEQNRQANVQPIPYTRREIQ